MRSPPFVSQLMNCASLSDVRFAPPIAQAPQAHLGFQGGYGSGRGAPPLPHVIASSNGPNNGPNGARGGPPPAPQ